MEDDGKHAESESQRQPFERPGKVQPAMMFLSMLYTLLIGPLELFFEVVFAVAFRFLQNPGLSIIFLSLAMNVLVLPLYHRADAVQEEQRDRANQMKPWVDHIKKTFKGDERFMMLQTYYRQNNYKQTDQLKGSISLLLEIPFFIAAFHFLSNLELLKGFRFGPIVDLGAPDALLQLGDVTLNALPILMTAINIVSAAIYLKGFPVSNKVQMYGIAAIFLLLLYNSPAGLVFYWTLNNIFSLVKNIFYKLRHPKEVLSVLVFILGVFLLVYVYVLYPSVASRLKTVLIIVGLLLLLPAIIMVARRTMPKSSDAPTKEPFPQLPAVDDRIFLFGCIFFAVVTGALIPSSVIASSPAEFVNIIDPKSPLWYVLQSLLLAAGTFLIWLRVFYSLATPNVQAIMSYAICAAVGIAIVNYMFFGTTYGELSPMLQYEHSVSATTRDTIVNLGVIAVIAALIYAVWRFRRTIVNVACLSLAVAVVVMSGANAVSITQNMTSIKKVTEQSSAQDRPHIELSRTGQNVVVIMLDRAVSYYIPFILNENPDIAKQFEGFTFYPNAISYGSHTNVGSPALYGGYDYRPQEMNERSDELLKDKQNEALKVMPVLFDEEGYKVTIFDPTYANYQTIPDLSIYDEYPEMNVYQTMDGSFKIDELQAEPTEEQEEVIWNRNFFCYSLVKIAPVFFQPGLYNEGVYNTTGSMSKSVIQVRYSEEEATGIDSTFLRSYAVLYNMANITSVSDDDTNTFFMMSNDTTHQPILLQEPEYEPAWVVDNTEYDSEHEYRYADDGRKISLHNGVSQPNDSWMMHYQVNTAALKQLGNWFDYLRENGAYDNTRIILVSDHGKGLWQTTDWVIKSEDVNGKEYWRDMQIFVCLLMEKDFGSTTYTTDYQFMTNADTPVMATEGLIDDATNPFTGNSLAANGRKDGLQYVTFPYSWEPSKNGKYVFHQGFWFSVHDDALEPSNWKYLGYY